MTAIRMRVAVVATFCALVVLPMAPARGQAGTVKLPTEFDALAYAPNSQTILFGQQGIETQLPGSVDDDEQVVVGLSTDGSVARVQVTQRLTVFGTGDYSFKVSGPARDFETLPESAQRPGLRKGALLWQGFAAGKEVLAAQVDLFPTQEAERLPVRFSLRMTVGGRPLAPGQRLSGPFKLELAVEDISAVPIGVADAVADPSTLAPILDTLRRALTSGRRPAPGRDGIPESIPVSGPAAQRQDQIEVPFRVEGDIRFPPGTLEGISVTGATTTTEADGIHVGFEAQVGGGADGRFDLAVEGQAAGLGLPDLDMTGRPALPLPRVLRPPVGRTWARAVAIAPARVDGRDMLARAMRVMWQVARLRQFDAYLGNPDINGRSTTSYRFRLAPLTRAAAVPVAGPEQADPWVQASAIVVLLLLTLGLALVWAHS